MTESHRARRVYVSELPDATIAALKTSRMESARVRLNALLND